MLQKQIIEKIVKNIKNIPKNWDGKEAILEMKKEGFKQWKQMEWIGWYFEYLCQKHLKQIMQFHKVKYGNTSFDGFVGVPFDFKSHALNTKNHKIVINDKESIQKAIEEYGYVIVIMALGWAKYNDKNGSFYRWHEKVKGGKSKYELERIEREAWSRLRKVKFDIKEIRLIKIDGDTLKRCSSFQENFRNANGSLRRSKIMISLNDIKENEIIEQVKFE